MRLPQEIAPGLRLERWKASPNVRWFYIKHEATGEDLCAPFVSYASNKVIVECARQVFAGAKWNRTKAQLLRRKRIVKEITERRKALLAALFKHELGR